MKKKLFSLLLAAALLVSALPMSAMATEAAEDTSVGMVETIYNPNYSIERLENGIKKVIDGEGRELILVPREMEVPEEYAESIVIPVPVHNAVFLSSTQVCGFRTVDDDETIACIGAVSGNADAWTDIPKVKEGLENGTILNFGSASTPDYELIQSLNPDVVFVYTGKSAQTAQIAKFEELGINYAVDNEYMEGNYLARMEWIRFLMTFFNADEKVDGVMKNVQSKIDEIKATIEGQEKPKVAYFTVSKGTVYATLSTDWKGSMLADMGGENVFPDMDSNTMTAEAAFEYVHDADVIIYGSTTTYTDGLSGILEAFPLLSECDAYKNGRVYLLGASFWHGIDQTDIMAGDLAAAIYPDLFPNREPVYYIHAE